VRRWSLFFYNSLHNLTRFCEFMWAKMWACGQKCGHISIHKITLGYLSAGASNFRL
jgi:hypothetical protein